MTPDLSKLLFDSSPFDGRKDFIAKVPVGVASRDELFAVLRQQLRFPDYFGENWDALSDCLRDLSWIKAQRVLIVHSDLPRLDSETLSTYLNVLLECVQDWKPGEDHELFVAFPENTRDAILDTIRKAAG